MQTIRKHPILILLIVNLAIGLITFRSYGLSWDEPLFYDYADALRYAYSPKEWFSGNFNLENAYGSSGTDHANRGPAYIIIARPIVSLAESAGLDNASAWHLVNFLTFQLGVYLFYRFASKWMNQTSALAASTFFAWQPLLWGHAFINPKDIPFLVFFIGSMCFGFEMVDELAQRKMLKPPSSAASPPPRANYSNRLLASTLLAAFFLGIATSIRVLGPLAAILTGLYALNQWKKIKPGELIKHFAIYGVFTLLVAFIAWPYLWTNPLQKFFEVFGFMSDNPTQLTVLFNSAQYRADELPRRYLPLLLGYTLTEPIWLLFALGLIVGFWKSDNQKRITLTLIVLWFFIPAAYVILRQPPMYDGFRHFLFILPPVFIFSGFVFESFVGQAFSLIPSRAMEFGGLQTRPTNARDWGKIALVIFILAFGVIPSFQLHPYQYAYYNTFAGNVSGAFRKYETEYWLTCYREAVVRLNEEAPAGTQLFVRREPYIAAYYASPNITIRDFRTEEKDMQPGDFYLVNTRSNEDLKFLRDQPAIIKVSRQGANFCLIKQVP
ncbi:MAG: hypothetical protein HYZ21_12805 [Chloroflexi bacterium]|nr:hypothetical protein [Chloroflexota bacterium]